MAQRSPKFLQPFSSSPQDSSVPFTTRAQVSDNSSEYNNGLLNNKESQYIPRSEVPYSDSGFWNIEPQQASHFQDATPYKDNNSRALPRTHSDLQYSGPLFKQPEYQNERFSSGSYAGYSTDNSRRRYPAVQQPSNRLEEHQKSNSIMGLINHSNSDLNPSGGLSDSPGFQFSGNNSISYDASDAEQGHWRKQNSQQESPHSMKNASLEHTGLPRPGDDNNIVKKMMSKVTGASMSPNVSSNNSIRPTTARASLQTHFNFEPRGSHQLKAFDTIIGPEEEEDQEDDDDDELIHAPFRFKSNEDSQQNQRQIIEAIPKSNHSVALFN